MLDPSEDHLQLPEALLSDPEMARVFFGAALGGISAGVWVCDHDCKLIFLNPAMERLAGTNGEKALGSRVPEEFPALFSENFKNLFKQARGGQKPLRYENLAATGADGRQSLHSGWLSPMLRDGRFAGMIGTAEVAGLPEHPLASIYNHICQDDQCMDCLLTHPQTLDTILRSVPVGIGLTVGRQFRWVSDHLLEMLGYRREELVGQSARMIYPDSEEFERVGIKAYAELEMGDKGETESVWQRKDGTLLDIHLSLVAISPAELEKGVIFTGLDITRRKSMEKELTHSEARFRTQYQGFPQPIFTWRAADPSGGDFVLVDANQAAYRITRDKVSDQMGKPASQVWESEPDLLRHMRTCFQDRKTIQVEGPYRFRSTEERRHLRVTLAYVPEDLVLIYVEDVSDRRAAEEQRRKLEVQMRHIQKLESLGVLAGGIAHDFNNLLMGVLGNAGLALMDLPPESPMRGYLEQIETTAKRLADLTSQLLAYSGRGKYLTRSIDLSAMVRGDVELLRTAVSKKAALRLNLAPDLSTAEADPSQLRQVLMNLVTNASEALEDSEGVITLTTGEMHLDTAYLRETFLAEDIPEGSYVFIEVSDTGKGMDPDVKSKMFDPFFTTKFAGRGLGLAAVLGIVRGHHGTVKVYSEVGQGSTVKVLLPAAARAGQKEAAPQEVSGAENGKTILVVDDEDLVLDVARRALKKSGMKVLTASDGQSGVELFRQEVAAIDLVLLDMTMPRLSGEEVYREIRRIKPEVPVILSSGYNQADATNRFAGKGLAGFLQKPYLPSKLIAKVREVLG